MPTWEEIQVHARKFIDEGMKILRSGVHEASYLAEATAKSADLHVSLRRNRLDRYKAVHQIGIYVCDEVECDPNKAEIGLTENIKKTMMHVKDLDEEARAFEEQISKLTVVKKEEKKPQSSKGQHPPRRKVSDQKK